MNGSARAYAASNVLALLNEGTMEHLEVGKYILGIPATDAYDGNDPEEEMCGVDDVMALVAKVHPNPGDAGSVRREIQVRIDAKRCEGKPEATSKTPK